MSRRGPRARLGDERIRHPGVLARYWLAQLPGTLLLVLVLIVLGRLFDIPFWIGAAVVAVWMVKDALLYPLLWRSFDPGYPSVHSMAGERGTAVGRIDPIGRVRVRGELWRAELATGASPIEDGEHVLVETTRDLTLLVTRAS